MARLITAPSTEPVTVAEVKSYGRVTHDVEDLIIARLIKACRSEIEAYIRRCYRSQVWEELYDSWPLDSNFKPKSIYAPYLPVVSSTIEVAGSDGVFVPFTNFSLRKDEGRVALLTSKPSPGIAADGIRIQWTVGYDTNTVLPEMETALLELVTYRFENRSGQSEEARVGIPAELRPQLDPLRVRNI